MRFPKFVTNPGLRKERIGFNNHYRNSFHWVEKYLKEKFNKWQPGVNNPLKYVQIAKDIGKSPLTIQ